jgi:hypothetical protein
MNKTETANLVEDIKDLWQQIKESRRVDPVEPQFEIPFFFDTAIDDAQLRLAALKSHIADPARFDAELQELTKEIHLCKLIGTLLFSSDEARRT